MNFLSIRPSPVIPAKAGIQRLCFYNRTPRSARKALDDTPLLRRALRAIRFADVRSGILPPHSCFRRNDGYASEAWGT